MTEKKILPRLVLTLCFVTLAGFIVACATTGVNRGDLNLVSLEEEWQLGDQLEQDLSRELTLVNDRSAISYVNQVGRRLVRRTEMAELPWEFHIVASPEINAFNIPGGHVYVHTGLIGAADDVAEFAGVMAHEIAHGVSRHGTEQLTRSQGLSLIAGAALGENPERYEQLLAQVLGTGALAKFSRDAEREADHRGVQYMAGAGYNPNGMAEMFETLLAQRQRRPSAVSQFFATHPLTKRRIADVRQQVRSMNLDPDRLTTRDPDFRTLQRRVARYNR